MFYLACSFLKNKIIKAIVTDFMIHKQLAKVISKSQLYREQEVSGPERREVDALIRLRFSCSVASQVLKIVNTQIGLSLPFFLGSLMGCGVDTHLSGPEPHTQP